MQSSAIVDLLAAALAEREEQASPTPARIAAPTTGHGTSTASHASRFPRIRGRFWNASTLATVPAHGHCNDDADFASPARRAVQAHALQFCAHSAQEDAWTETVSSISASRCS